MRPGAIVRVRTRFDVQRRLSAQIPTVPLRAANARGRRPAEIDTAGASPTGREHQTSSYSDLRFRCQTSGAQPSSRACCATVAPQSAPIDGGYRPLNSGSASTGNLLIYREIRPSSLLRGGLRIPVAVSPDLQDSVVRAVSARVLNKPLCVPRRGPSTPATRNRGEEGPRADPTAGPTVDDAAIPELAAGRTTRPVDGNGPAWSRGWRLALGARRRLLLVLLSAERSRGAVHDAAQELILSLDESVGHIHRSVDDFSPAGWTLAMW